jgi:hypothetical protein
VLTSVITASFRNVLVLPGLHVLFHISDFPMPLGHPCRSAAVLRPLSRLLHANWIRRLSWSRLSRGRPVLQQQLRLVTTVAPQTRVAFAVSSCSHLLRGRPVLLKQLRLTRLLLHKRALHSPFLCGHNCRAADPCVSRFCILPRLCPASAFAPLVPPLNARLFLMVTLGSVSSK